MRLFFIDHENNPSLDLLLEDEESDPEEKELQVKAHKLNDYVMIT